MKENKVLLWGIGIALAVLCCAAVIGLGAVQMFSPALPDLVSGAIETVTPTPIPVIERDPVATLPPPATPTSRPTVAAETPQPTETAARADTPTPTTGREGGQASPLQLSTEQQLLQAVLPERDQRLLAIRLKHGGQEIPLTASEPHPEFQVGDTDIFWITDNQDTPPRQFEITAEVQYVTEHAYWWVEEGYRVDAEALQRSAERFETQTYPTNREFFGSEWSPGVDNDIRVNVLLGNVPGVAGYFSASNSFSKLAEPYSNEREMFFINLEAISPGNDYFDGVLAHEFQHMIHWNQDRNEDTWVNEGLSELATFVNGYGVSGFVGAYVYTPDTQLNAWGDAPGGSLAHYGGSFLFMAYFLQRYGEEMTQAVVAHPDHGIGGFNAVLADHGYSERFEDIFADFLVANYLQDPEAGEGVWGYKNLTMEPVALTERYAAYPVEQQTTVYQYGGDYIELLGEGDLTLEFTGSTQVKVVNNEPHSGRYQWYSHRGDETNTRLTRAFDLSQVSEATLTYWTWYDIEADWDYGYVEISTNDGISWTILQTPHSATGNPSGNAFGPGYTGTSGDGPTWVEESLDLSAYTGQEVLIRFEYVTDDAINRPGWTLDDIRIPEIGFSDDGESGLNGWQAEGFVRIENVLPQRFVVQVVEIGDDIQVHSLPLDATNYGTLTLNGLGSTVDQAVMIVSGLTPVTTEPASYQYKLSQ